MSWLISTAHAADAPAAAPQDGGLISFGLLGVMFVVFYFLILRPQSKRAKEQKQMINALAKGDEVTTNGGILGKVVKVVDDYVVLEIANNIELKFHKQNITSTLPKGTLKNIAQG